MIDQDDRILLVRFEFPDGRSGRRRAVGSSRASVPRTRSGASSKRRRASRRQRSGRCSGRGCTSIPFIGGQWDGQREQYHLVRTASFAPEPRLSWEQLNAEYVFELRWWTPAQLGEAVETFAPRRLPELVLSLVRDGPPEEPIDVGV